MRPLDKSCVLFTLRILFIVFAVVQFCNFERAEAQIMLGASPEALGGAGRATSNALDAHFLNPGALIFGKGVNIGGTFQEGDISLPTPVNNYNFEVTENDPEKPMAGGFAYTYKRSSTPNYTIYDQDLSVSLSGRIVPSVGLGLQGHRLFRQNSAGPGYVKYNMTFGVLAVPAPWLGLGFAAYDFLGDNDQVLIPTLALGTQFIVMDIMRIRLDLTRPEIQNPNHNFIYSAGTEFSLGYDLFLRVGGKWDQVQVVNQTYFTAGFGFEGPKLNVGYAYRNNINVDGDAYHTFQTWLTFQ